jgi:phosphopantothenoylcysteine decarboxylase/phosphopantothenate--cysteine ligase
MVTPPHKNTDNSRENKGSQIPLLQNKRILLGVTGGIAAYKSAELVRRLQDRGASVRVVMTAAAQEFITPLTLQALSGNPVHTDLLDPAAEAAMGHIELARWADLVLIAPATADFIARLAQGQGNDLLTTLCLATRAPIAIAPAMNQGMWAQDSTQANLRTLQQRHVVQMGPAEGSQACGEVGPGRMLEPEDLAEQAGRLFQAGSLTGKTVVITAGPTREAIDPVRYLSNHSSGKMGYALATAAAEAGARTLLISGPTALAAPDRVEFRAVTSAQEMYEASLTAAVDADVFIAAAAVADYRPAEVASQKLKKSGAESMQLVLVKNPDIVAAVAQSSPRPFTVGFAAETEQLVAHARAKLKAKNLDMVVANDVSNAAIGFNSDDNAVTLVTANGEQVFEQRDKNQLARELIKLIAAQLKTAQ